MSSYPFALSDYFIHLIQRHARDAILLSTECSLKTLRIRSKAHSCLNLERSIRFTMHNGRNEEKHTRNHMWPQVAMRECYHRPPACQTFDRRRDDNRDRSIEVFLTGDPSEMAKLPCTEPGKFTGISCRAVWRDVGHAVATNLEVGELPVN
jgi:hypothetical protein